MDLADMSGRIGPLPLTGYDLIAIAGVALVMAGAALLLRRAVACRHAIASPARGDQWDAVHPAGAASLPSVIDELDLLEAVLGESPSCLVALFVGGAEADQTPARRTERHRYRDSKSVVHGLT